MERHAKNVVTYALDRNAPIKYPMNQTYANTHSMEAIDVCIHWKVICTLKEGF